MPPEPSPPVLGRASPASSRPATLRSAATATSAAYRADGGDGSGWVVRGATVAGVRHRLAGAGPEDAYGWCLVAPGADPATGDEATGTVVVAVADGVGGVAGSAAASGAAVEAACDAAAAALAGGADLPGADPGGAVWRAVFAAAAAAVRVAGGATTLVVAVVGPRTVADGGPHSAAVARIGDSTAFVLGDAGWVELWPVAPADDAPFSTATAALSHRPADPAPEAVVVALADDEVLVLVSDGIANPLRDGPTTVAPAMAAALREPPGPLGLALLADFSRQGCFDDRTIIGVWPQPEPAVDGADGRARSEPDEEAEPRRT